MVGIPSLILSYISEQSRFGFKLVMSFVPELLLTATPLTSRELTIVELVRTLRDVADWRSQLQSGDDASESHQSWR